VRLHLGDAPIEMSSQASRQTARSRRSPVTGCPDAPGQRWPVGYDVPVSPPQETATMRGYGIIGTIVTIVVIIVVLRFLGVV
jgi:hypothetical protein